MFYKRRNLFKGLLFLLIGILMIGGKTLFGDLPIIKISITILLLLIAIKNLIERDFFSGVYLVAIGAFLNRDYLGIRDFPFFLTYLLGPAFIAMGLSYLFSKNNKKIFLNMGLNGEDKEYRADFTGKSTQYSKEKKIEISRVFGESISYVSSEDFESGRISGVFSRIILYLDKAEIDERCYLSTDLVFSNLELYIPKNWRVTSNDSSVLSGIKFYGKPAEERVDKELRLDSNQVFSAIKIYYV